MEDRKEAARKVIGDHEALIDRALDVVEKAPYWAHVWEDDWDQVRLFIDGDVVTLSWRRAESDYDGCALETGTVEFPLWLLVCDDADFEKWKREEAVKHEKKERARKRQRLAEQRAAERAQFEALRAKYGDQ